MAHGGILCVHPPTLQRQRPSRGLLACPAGLVAGLEMGSIAAVVFAVLTLVGVAEVRLAIRAACLVAIFVVDALDGAALGVGALDGCSAGGGAAHHSNAAEQQGGTGGEIVKETHGRLR